MGIFLGSEASPRVRYLARHFGGFITFCVSWRNHDIGGRTGRTRGGLARAARDFFKGFDVFAPENPNFSLVPMAHMGQSWDILSSSGAKSLPIFLMSGILNWWAESVCDL